VGKFKTKMEQFRSSKKSSYYCSRRRSSWHVNRLVWLFSITLIAGCQSLKEAAVVSTAAGVGAVAGTAISGGVIAPIAGAMTGAFVADATTEVLTSPAQTIVEAEANFFSILEKLVEIGGWALVLVFIGPMIIALLRGKRSHEVQVYFFISVYCKPSRRWPNHSNCRLQEHFSY
jgi:hypothetical protein